ncbi:Apolipophorin, partial [Stegodyphus mimosarum]
MASHRKLVLLCAFVVSAVAVPTRKREQCARYCTDEADFTLRPGSTYTYDYETTTVTTVQGPSQDKTQLQMSAQVDIEVLSKCDLSLRLRGVNLKLSDPETPDYLNSIRGVRDFARTIERHILRFSFQNGKIEHVCPTEDVPAWVLNIQKGVLSAFQTHVVRPDWATRTLETDILGKCTAEYHSLGRSWQGMHTVRKLKDLSTCTDRENVETYLQGTPYTQDFMTRSLPLLKGRQECEQVLGNGYLQSSICNEEITFRPFSNGGNGVITTVSQKLSHATTSSRTFTGNDYRPTQEPLLYRHAKEELNAARIVDESEVALKELCEASKQDISMTVPRKFSAFVYKLKKLPFASLKSFYQKVDSICPENPKARKFFIDAIPMVATSESARFMYEMIRQRDLSESESNFWLTSLSFVNEPTAEMIATFTPLLDGRNEQALLGISAFIHNFCRSHECSSYPQVRAAVHKLVENLGDNCYTPEDKKIILTLKALGNIGHMFGKEYIVEACYKNPQIRTEARLAAIDTFRRVGCDVSRESLMNLFSNYNEDTEIRIAAYLAIMKCPNSKTIQDIKNIFMNEKINQVGSFIWTHMNALAKSRHPERQDIRDIVSNLYLLNKYESDARKVSSAREATFFLESIDSGFHIDNHLIFSTDSYLPRTAMFNLTVDIFGKTCNLFQIDGRMEGLEHVVESFFGPHGYFPQKNVAKLLREKRSISNNKIDDLDEKFDAQSRFQQQPYGSLDVKIFGTSMWYNQFKANEDGVPEINLLDFVTKLAEEQEKEYSKSFMFLDTTFTVPMTSGLPLRIAVNGTANVGLKIGGKFNVKSFQHVDIMGHIEPSGAIEIASLLSVDAGNVAKSGMRVVGTMHSSTVLDGRLEVRNGEVVKAQLNMPRDRIDVFNMESKVYLVHGHEEREQKVDKKDGTYLSSCSGETFSKLFGVSFCSELRVPPYRPNSYLHPINGPAAFNLFIRKTDLSLKSYNFDAQWKKELKNGAYSRYGMISVVTPHSQIERNIKFEVSAGQKDNSISLKMKTPLKKLDINAMFLRENSQSKLTTNIVVDDKFFFGLDSGLRTVNEKNAVSYMASLEMKAPTKKLVTMSGSTTLKFGEKYSAEMKIEDLTQRPIIAKGNLEFRGQDRYDTEMSLSSYAVDGTVRGFAQLSGSMSAKMTADYRIMEGKMNKLSITGKMRNLSVSALTKYNGLLNIETSFLPEWNTEVSFETMKTTGHIENTVSITLGDGIRSRAHTIKFQEILRYSGTLKNNVIDGSLSLAYPEKNIDYSVHVNHENTEKYLKNSLKFQYDTNKQINTDIQLNFNTEYPLSFTTDMKLRYPGHSGAARLAINQSNAKEYRATMSYQWQERSTDVIIHYKDKSEGSRFKYEVDGRLQLPSARPTVFSTTLGFHKSQFALSSELNVGINKYQMKADYIGGNSLNHRFIGQVSSNNDVYALEAAIQQQRNKLNCNAEIKMPNRQRITTKIEGRMGDNLRIGSFEILWDADRDNSKRFAVTSELRSKPDGYDSKIALEVYRRRMTGALSIGLQGDLRNSQWKTNNRAEFEWAPNKKVTAVLAANMEIDRSRQQVNSHFELATPYNGYENLTLSITHLYANQQWDSEISSNLPGRNQFSVSSTGRFNFARGGANIDAKGKIHTSFMQLENLYMELNHDHNPIDLSSKAQIKWNNYDKIILELSGNRHIESNTLKGVIKVKTPFSYMEDISAEINHSYSTYNYYRTYGSLQWAPRRQITLNFEGNHQLSGRRRTCTISLKGTSPYRGYENVEGKVIYNNDGSSLNTDGELIWNKNKITSSVSGLFRNTLYYKNFESKIQFTTPFRNYEAVELSSSLEINQNSYKLNVDTRLPYSSTVSLNSVGKMNSFNDIELNALLVAESPKYMDPKRGSIDFVHKLINSKLQSTLDAVFGNERFTILLSGLSESSYNTKNIEFSATINTTFRKYEELKIDLTHNQRDADYLTKLHLTKNKLSGSLNHALIFRDWLNFDTQAELISNSPMLNGKISITHEGKGHLLQHRSSLLWDKNKEIKLNAEYSNKFYSKEFNVKISTPFRTIREIEVVSGYEYQNPQRKGRLIVSWDRRNKMELIGNFDNYQWENVNAKLEFTSPFKGHEFYSSLIKYDLSSAQKTAEFSCLWGSANKKEIVAKVNFLKSYRSLNLETVLETPFDEMKKVSFSAACNYNKAEKSLSLVYAKNDNSFVLNGRSLIRREGALINVDLSTPYRTLRELKTSAKYDRLRNGMSGELFLDWNRANTYKMNGQYELKGTSVEANFEVVTPIEGYENVVLEVNGNYESNKFNSQVNLMWSKNRKIFIDILSEYDSRSGYVTFRAESPFPKYREIRFESNYEKKSGQYSGKVTTVINRRNTYEGVLGVTYGGKNIAKINLRFVSPIVNFREIEITSSIDAEPGSYQFSSNVKMENNEISSLIYLSKQGKEYMECKVKVNTNFERFRVFSLDSSLRNDDYSVVEGRIDLVTPFEILRSFEARGEYKLNEDGGFISLKSKTPHRSLNIEGNMSNSQFRPLTASLEINAPFTTFKKISTNAEINVIQWNDAQLKFSTKSPIFAHTFDVSFQKDDDDLSFELKADSSALPSRTAIISWKASYNLPKRTETEISVELLGKVHYINGQFKDSGRDMDVQVTIESSLLPENKADLSASYARRRNNKVLEGKVYFIVPSSTHQIVANYETKGNQIASTLKIDSSVLSFSTLNAQAKYINNNGRDIEAAFSVSTPETTHAITGSLKNYEREKFIQLKLECPLAASLNPFTITGTLNHENFDAMDGSLIVTTPDNEVRVAGSMKKVGWENVEAFLTINTPIKSLRMLRIDGRYLNDNFQNVECNFQLETSNENFPELGLTSKISRTQSSEEMSLMLRLPVRNYQSVQLLANAHHDARFSNADSRITLTLPKSRYVAYSQYGISKNRISGRVELELAGFKWVTSGRLENTVQQKDVSLSLSTPSENTYIFGGAYGSIGNRQQLTATYSSPSNERYNLNSSLSFRNFGNFEVEFDVETPFYRYRTMQAKIKQEYIFNRHFATTVECWKNGRHGLFRIQNHMTRDGLKGVIQLACPYTKTRDIKLHYTHQKRSSTSECNLEFDYNKVKQLKVGLLQISDKTAHITLDVPVLPLTVTADSKKDLNSREIKFTSTYQNRAVAFRTSYTAEDNEFRHDASFAWDESREKRISYDIKMADTETGKELWSRLDTPLRSLMMKGNFTRTSRASSGGVDFYWDASRSLEKHMAVGIQHADVSSYRETSHRVQITVEHPKLPKAVIQTNTLTFRPSEIHGKSELIYSTNGYHNILMEFKAFDLSGGSRDIHYKGEFSLKHPINRLNVKGVGEITDGKIESSAHFKVESLDRPQVQNVREIKAKLLKTRQQLDLVVRNNDDQMTVLGQVTGRNGDINVSVTRKMNEIIDLTSQIRYSKRNRMLDVSVSNAENSGVQFAAAFPKDSASLKVSHSTRGNVINDASVYLGLEESKVLKSQVNWRPRLWEELRINTGETLRGFIESSKSRYTAMKSALSNEWASRSTVLVQSMSQELSPVFEDLRNSASDIANDLQSARDAFWNMYNRNEFYMKDIVKNGKALKKFMSDLADGLVLACEVTCNIVMEFLEDTYDRIYYKCLDFFDYLQDMYARWAVMAKQAFRNAQEATRKGLITCAMKLEQYGNLISKKLGEFSDYVILKLDKLVRAYAPCFIDGYYYMKNAADSIRYSVNGIMTEVSDCIFSNRYYLALRNYAYSVMDTIQAFRDYEYMESAQAFINRIYDAEILNNVINHPSVEYMSGIANSALRKSVEVYHTLGMDTLVNTASDAISNYAKTLALQTAQDLLSEFYHMKGGAKYDFAPERGYMAIEFNLPTTRNSLIEVFDFKSYPEYQKMMNVKNSLAVDFYEDFCIWDFYYKFMKYFTPSYWLPSFTAHAMLAGNQHYITFDKLPFEFAGRCSYLLARDFVDGNFSVIVNYGREDHQRKSLTILTEGKKIDIGQDYKVTLDDTKTELPIQIGKTIVIREGANVRIENEKKGFSAVCNFVRNYCSLTLSGFYFGKTGGLFGTFNYEPSLDMMTPTRHLADDVESFARSWEVGQMACRSTENLATLPSNDYMVQKKCRNMFEKSSSEFRACFKQVDPENYLRMCINDLSAVHESVHDAVICQSAAAYFAECKMAGVPLKMSKDCVLCEKQDGTMMKEGEALKFTRGNSVTAADVVFLIEEKACNKDRVKYLGKLAQNIEDNFRQKGYRDIRYSVVGFGGDEVHAAPHIHTMDGQESGPLRSLTSALESMEYGDGPVNILEALRFAAALNFRSGTVKSFILLKCSTCKSEEVRAEYGEMLRTLLDGDITLHLVMEQKYEMKVPNKNSKARRVIGVDKKFAYTLKDVKDSQLSGDGDLLAQLKIPKDVCIPLALEVNGSSFDSQFLTETKKNTNKKFMDVLARLVVRSSSEGSTEWGMCCECIATNDGMGKSTCQRCVSAEIASMISADTSSFGNYPSSRPENK